MWGGVALSGAALLRYPGRWGSIFIGAAAPKNVGKIVIVEVVRRSVAVHDEDAALTHGGQVVAAADLCKCIGADNVWVSILGEQIGNPHPEDKNWCGGTGAMLSFAPDGKAYPCIRYAPISVGKELAAPMCLGNCRDGLYTTEQQRKTKEMLDAITLTTQSTQECIDCPVATGCSWCSGFNYEVYGTPNKRVTRICKAHKTRNEIIIGVPNRKAETIVRAVDALERKLGARKFRAIFKSITFDNGTEFAAAESLERSCINKTIPRTRVYYCHPYSSWERGSNEHVNGMIRRRHPKGTDFSKVSKEEIAATEKWINEYPRRIFGYKSSAIMFQECLNELGIAI